jgi:hypothetical protein
MVMVQGFERAQAEYESKMMNPFDYEPIDIEEDSAYWSKIDCEMEDMKLGEL